LSAVWLILKNSCAESLVPLQFHPGVTEDGPVPQHPSIPMSLFFATAGAEHVTFVAPDGHFTKTHISMPADVAWMSGWSR
jgi:hypothetical protein